ncbi:hypothetical protein V3H18_07040 [Methylocystis sp. 9N]|uniref:Transposase n=1 Tax=Methylocystis borbori TaxID=3118750 RepID=A0ABU7XGY1_9HYPH
MMIVSAGVKAHLGLGYADMRKGVDGLAVFIQEALKKDPSRAICRLPRKEGDAVKDLFLGRAVGFARLRKA